MEAGRIWAVVDLLPLISWRFPRHAEGSRIFRQAF